MNDAGNSPSRDLKERTKSFAVRIVKLYAALPKQTEAQVLGKQLLRSGTSAGAHYSEATRSRSPAEFISKVEVGLQELEETDLDRLVDWMRDRSSRSPASALVRDQRTACDVHRQREDDQEQEIEINSNG